MQRKTLLLKIIIAIILSIFCYLSFNIQNQSSILNAKKITNIKKIQAHATPSVSKQSKFGRLHWYWVAGFKEQPDSDYYVQKIGDTINIHTIVAINELSNRFSPTEYYWWTSSQDGKWHELSDGDNNGQIVKKDGSDLHIKVTKPGTMYYQLGAKVYPELYNPDRTWSKMTAVHFQEKIIDSTKLSITEFPDYIYLNPEFSESNIYAKASTEPNDATDRANIRWSLDDEDLDIADINPKTGEITLKGKLLTDESSSHFITIHASLTTSNNKILEDSIKIPVSNNPLSVNNPIQLGNNAILSLNGNFNDYYFEWHEKYNGNDTKITTTIFNQSISIPISNMSYNGRQYYVKFINLNDKSEDNADYPNSNIVTLNVLNNYADISASQTIENKTYTESNTKEKNTINQVSPSDKITHSINIQSPTSISEGTLTYYLPLNESIKSIEEDHTELKYKIEKQSEQNKINVTGINISSSKPSTINICTMNNGIKNKKFEYYGSLEFISSDEKTKNIKIPSAFANFIENNIQIFPKSIKFGTITGFGHYIKQRIFPHVDQDIVDIKDTRRKKTYASIQLNYSNEFISKSKPDKKLPVQLMFFDKKNHQIISPNNNVIVAQSDKNNLLHNVYWNKNEGLKLLINLFTGFKGTYYSHLVWTINETP